jgi:hypothetical protein
MKKTVKKPVKKYKDGNQVTSKNAGNKNAGNIAAAKDSAYRKTYGDNYKYQIDNAKSVGLSEKNQRITTESPTPFQNYLKNNPGARAKDTTAVDSSASAWGFRNKKKGGAVKNSAKKTMASKSKKK